jgi:hypothetical protein
VGHANRDFLESEIFPAPLLGARGRLTMVLAVVAFRPGGAAWREADAGMDSGNNTGARPKDAKR